MRTRNTLGHDEAIARFVAIPPHCAVIAAIAGLALAPVSVVRADQVLIEGVSRAPVKVLGLEGGRLKYQTADGVTTSTWLHDVQRITVDRGGRFLDFNEAERSLAGGNASQAIARYRRMLRVSESFWPDLIAARLVRACALAERIDQAALHFVQVLRGERGGPPLAVRLIPQRLPAHRNARVVRAIGHLEGALRETQSGERRIPLELFRFALMQGTGDHRSVSAARDVASLDVPGPLSCRRFFALQLLALEVVLRASPGDVPLPSLDRGIRDCPEALLPGFLQIKGEALLHRAVTREDRIRAAWPFMRIAIHMPDDDRVPRALLGAARALEGIGNWSKAVELLDESLAHPSIDGDTRVLVEKRLREIQGVDPAPSASKRLESN